jgi:hypothetical protein
MYADNLKVYHASRKLLWYRLTHIDSEKYYPKTEFVSLAVVIFTTKREIIVHKNVFLQMIMRVKSIKQITIINTRTSKKSIN